MAKAMIQFLTRLGATSPMLEEMTGLQARYVAMGYTLQEAQRLTAGTPRIRY